MLSPGAFNALLKTLEEPPEHTIFILATTEIHKVPITVLSRCQRYDFRRIDGKVICDHIKKIAYKEGFTVEDEAAQLISKLGDGSMRDAISLLDRCLSDSDTITYENAVSSLSLPENELIGSIWSAVCSQDVSGALTHFNNAYSDGCDIISIFDNILSLIRDIYIVKSVKDISNITLASPFTVKELTEMAKSCDTALLDYFIETINSTLSRLTRTSARKMDGEVCLIKLCSRAVKPSAAIPAKAADSPKPNVKSENKAVKPSPISDEAPMPTDDDAPPFDIPENQRKSLTYIPKIQTPKTEPIQKPSDDDQFKKDFLNKLGSGVNVATRSFLSKASIVAVGDNVIVVCDNDYLEFIQRTSVLNALTKTAKDMGFSSATVTDKMPKVKADTVMPKEEKAPKGMDELIEKAKKLGLMH